MHFCFPFTYASCSSSQEFLEEDFTLLSEERVEVPTSEYEMMGKDGKIFPTNPKPLFLYDTVKKEYQRNCTDIFWLSDVMSCLTDLQHFHPKWWMCFQKSPEYK